MAIGHHRLLLSLVLVCGACRPETSADAPVEHPTPAAKVPDAPDTMDPAIDRPTVDVDLSASGIGATIRGPEGAKAAAHGDYVTVDAEPDFHMQVHRGPVDVLAEKADLVKTWGLGFRRFVQDDKTAIIYETELAGDHRFHFLSWGEQGGLLYHCRSDKRGAESVVAVRRMLDGCHAVTVHERVAGEPSRQ
jgi:hypothetical protein